MKILGIETSCDETAAAVIDEYKVLSNVVATQIDIHAQYGGVVPEVASRSHIAEIMPVIDQALRKANVSLEEIDAIAVTAGPGLLGSLLIGVMTAKTLAAVTGKPIIGVNHIIAHALAGFATDTPPDFPLLALTVSGGHSALTLYRQDLSFEIVGQTQDDAAGEAFDKVAKLLNLAYPGGPAISKAAQSGDEDAYSFPIAKMSNPYDFSFSGLKTAVLRTVQQITGENPGDLTHKKTYELDDATIADVAASFEKSVVNSLVRNTVRAAEDFQPASVVVGGGVAANTRLRSELHRALPQTLFVPTEYCGDNAVMIAVSGLKMRQNGFIQSPSEISANSRMTTLL